MILLIATLLFSPIEMQRGTPTLIGEVDVGVAIASPKSSLINRSPSFLLPKMEKQGIPNYKGIYQSI
jgi:hypothetical protein